MSKKKLLENFFKEYGDGDIEIGKEYIDEILKNKFQGNLECNEIEFTSIEVLENIRDIYELEDAIEAIISEMDERSISNDDRDGYSDREEYWDK